MFNLNPAPTFKATVGLSVPGVSEPLDVAFTFRHKTRTAVVAWSEAYVKDPSAETLHQVIVDWDLRKDGEPVPYSFAALAELLEAYTPSRLEISDGYLIEVTRAKRKNS